MAGQTFKNLSDLQAYVKKNSLDIQLSNGSTLKDLMKQAGELLKSILIKNIEIFYSDHTPSFYDRTFNFINSLQMKNPVKDGDGIITEIYFDDTANHPSVTGGQEGFVPILIDQGYKDKSLNPPEFLGYAGNHFIEKSIEEFLSKSDFKFKITVHYEPPDGGSWEVLY